MCFYYANSAEFCIRLYVINLYKYLWTHPRSHSRLGSSTNVFHTTPPKDTGLMSPHYSGTIVMEKRETWERLIKVALEDNFLSKDEQILLRKILSNLEAYHEALDQAFEDGVIDNKEKLNLLTLRLKLINEMNSTAKADTKITAEEQNLIKSALVIINELQRMEITRSAD